MFVLFFVFFNCSFSTSFIFLALRKTIINHNKEGGSGVNRRFEQALQKNHIGTKIRWYWKRYFCFYLSFKPTKNRLHWTWRYWVFRMNRSKKMFLKLFLLFVCMCVYVVFGSSLILFVFLSKRDCIQVACRNFAQKVEDAMLRPETTQAPQLIRMAEEELTKRPTPLVVAASLSQHDVSQGRGLSAENIDFLCLHTSIDFNISIVWWDPKQIILWFWTYEY